MRRRGGLLFLSLLSSCAGAPEIAHPRLDFDVPARWGTELPASDGFGKWWQEFGDPRLDAVIEHALAHNYDLEAAAARVVTAAAQASIAGADVLPQLSGVFDGSRTQRNFIGFPIPGRSGDVLTTRSTVLGVSLNLDWEIDVWGRIRAGRSAALADVEAARADAHAARLSLAGQTTKLWFALIESRRQVDLARATLENFRSTHERIVSRYERGLRSSLDLRFSLTNIAAAEAALANRKAELDGLTRQLETLLGRYPDASLEVSRELPEMKAGIPACLPSDLACRRPDLAAAERRLASAGARVKEARRALFPRFSLTASGGSSSSELKDLVNGDFGVWNLAGNIAQPVFQGGRLVAGLDLAKSRERERLAIYASAVLNAFREVEAAVASERYLRERVEALRTATEQSTAARQLAEDRYDRGLDDIITVLEAQRRAFQSESELMAAERLSLENRVDLYLALGGDFGDFQGPDPSADDSKEADTP